MGRMPDFLIIGAAKAGTTSLFRYLGQHPDVFISPVKEPNFFAYAGQEVNFQGPKANQLINKWSVTTLQAYQALFEPAEAAEVTGEASFTSLYVPDALPRIQHLIPEVKLIVLLRDPVERAYSNFKMNVQACLEPCDDFAQALDEETARIRAGWGPAWHYRQLGFYHAQLARCHKLFPADQIRVYLLDDLATNARSVVQEVFDFIGVDSAFEPDVSKRHNRSEIPKSDLLRRLMRSRNPLRATARTLTTLKMRKSIAHHLRIWTGRKVPRSVRYRLQQHYRDDILALQKLLRRDLTYWLEAP